MARPRTQWNRTRRDFATPRGVIDRPDRGPIERGWEKSFTPGPPPALSSVVSTLNPAEAAAWRKLSIETTYKNLTPAQHKRLRRAARSLLRTVGKEGLRSLLLNSGLPGKVLSFILDALAQMNPEYATKPPPSTVRWWRSGQTANGYGMCLSTSVATPPTNIVALPQQQWPYHMWSRTLTFPFHHVCAAPYVASLKRYAFSYTLTGAAAAAGVQAFSRGRVHIKPRAKNRGRYRPMETMPLGPPPALPPFSMTTTRFSSPFAGRKPGESKTSPRVSKLLMTVKSLLGNVTEALDFLNVVYAASGGYDSNAGLERNSSYGWVERMDWLINQGGIANFDWDRFVVLLALESLQDYAIGKSSKMTIDNFKNSGWSGLTGPTVGPAL